METIRNAATVAASYVGLNGQDDTETETSRVTGGEAPQNTASTFSNTQSGTEPVSGKLGLGRGGEPYDAGNDQGTSALGSSSTYNPTSTQTSSQSTGRQGGLTSGTTSTSNKYSTSTSQVGSEPLSEKVESVFGIGGSSRESHLGGGNSGPGYGQSSKLGSTVAHGTNPESQLYNAKNAPGIGGHRLDDDFSSANIRHEGANRLPAEKGSDAAAGHSGIGSSGVSGLTSGSSNTSSSGGLSGNRGVATGDSRSGTSSSSGVAAGLASTLGYGQSSGETGRNTTSGTSRTSGGVGETIARKVDEYTPGNSTSQTGYGHNTGNTRGYEGTMSQTTSGLTGERGLTGGAASSHTRSGHGYEVEPIDQGEPNCSNDLSDHCIEGREGYKPHGGHPIGEAAHHTDDGKATFLDYRNDTSLPLGRGRPADK